MSNHRNKKKVSPIDQALRQDQFYGWFRFGLRAIAVILALLALGLLIGLAVSKLGAGKKTAPDQTPTTKAAPTSSATTGLASVAAVNDVYGGLSPARVAELTKFRDQVVMPWLNDQVFTGHHPIKAVRDRLEFVRTTAEKRFGHKVEIVVMSDYLSGVSKKVSAAAHVPAEGTPTVFLSLSSLHDIFEQCNTLGPEGATMFMNHIVATFEHEVEHLAFSKQYQKDQQRSYEEFVAEEAKTYHNSCQYIIEPILADNQKAFAPLIMSLYHAWVKAGRKPDSPAWIAYIKSVNPQTDLSGAVNLPKN